MTGEIWKRSKKVLAYALALMMVVGVVQTVAPVRATEGTGETGIATAADTTTSTTTSLTATVSCNDDYSLTITETGDAPEGIKRWYSITCGSYIWNQTLISAEQVGANKKVPLNRHIYDTTGTYKGNVWATDNEGKTIYSKTYEFSYDTQPTDALVVKEVKWLTSNPGKVEWTLSGNSSDVLEYRIWLDKSYDGKNFVWAGGDDDFVTGTTYDWSKWITDINASYKVWVTAISKNIASKRNSETVDTSDFYKPSETVNNVKTGIAGALWNTVSNNTDIVNTISSNNAATNEAAKIVQALKDVSANSSINNSTVATAVETALKAQDKNGLKLAMQNDSKMVELVEVVEQMKGGLATAEVSANDTVAKEIFGVSANNVKIKVVGAKLNNATKLTLEKSATQTNNGLYISEEYSSENAVALDIKLSNGASAVTTLSIPVSVTVPVPKSINKSRLVILHMKNNNEVEETLTPIPNSDGTVTFTVSHFSTFVFTEKTTSGGSSGGGGRQDDTVEALITVAAAGATVKTKDITTLSNSTMKALLKRGDVTLVMEYTYKGVDYVVTIPAGKAVDNDIPWYGPLYLAGMYGNGTGADKADKTADTVYVVKRGDTMSKIAKMSGMSLAELAKKNPQIKNLNRIRVGQSINR